MDDGIDETEWPIVAVSWTGTVSDAELRAFLTRLDAWLERGQRFGLLIDSREAKGFSPEQRVTVIDHMRKQAPLTTKFLVQAVVLSSLMQRTLFYGINLIYPNPFPSKIFGDPAQARAWLRNSLAQR